VSVVAGRWLPLASGLGVALLLGALTAPVALSRWWLSPDAIEYLAIANAWVHGAGFVDPVRWNFFLDASAPLPGFAVRAPALSALLSLPLGFGASLSGVGLCHALFASAVGGAVVLVARRSMSTGAAVAAALVLGLAPFWLRASVVVLSEVTGVAALLLVIATARGVLRSAPGALLCATATLLAWTARPNLLALGVAVAVAAVVELGPRRAIRHRPLQVYVLALATLYTMTRVVVEAVTGFSPYAGYGVAREIFGADDGFSFQKEYVGAWTFARMNANAIVGRVGEFGAWLVRELCFGARYHLVGWLLLPGLVHSLLRRGDGAFEQRIAALSGIGFAATTLAYFAAFDPWRYPIFTAVCSILAGMAWLDAAARHLAARQAARPALAAGLRNAPLAVCVLLLVVFRLPSAGERALASLDSYREHGTFDGTTSRSVRALSAVCSSIREPGRVAAVEPWDVVLRCGQAAVRTPPDLVNEAWRTRFIRSEGIRYFLGDETPITQWLANSPALRRLANAGPYTLYEVRDPSLEAPEWTPPPPLACAGREPECLRSVARIPPMAPEGS
jgi:hypothetical protein